MKKILLSVLALLAFAASGTAQTLPSYVPTNGLVGWWPFNGNANDESGNGNNGTVNGAILSADRNNMPNSAYFFNGSAVNQDYIKTVNPIGNADSFSISFWISRNELSNNGKWSLMISSINNLPGSYEFFSFEDTIYFRNWGNLTTGLNFDIKQKVSYSNNSYFNISVTSRFNTTKLFINGQFVAETNIPKIKPIDGDLFIGKHANFIPSSNSSFNGKIDDIAIYNRALTQQEITALYQGANTTANCPTFPASLAQGLVGYWPFCGNALDESGNNNHGTVNGATLTADRFGNAGSAYGFDGVNDLIKINHSVPLNAFPMSISIWCQGNSQYGSLISKYTSCSSNNGWQLHSMEGKISTYSYNFLGGAYLNCDGDISKIISDNIWYNIVSTYDLLGVKIYVNNVLVFTKPYVGNGNMSAYTNSQDVYIGTELNSINCSPFSTYYSGQIDDIAIWNRVLTPQEITQLYNQGICQTSITVTDTLLIHTGITSYNPVAYGNTLKVWPNPGNTAITLDAGNLALMQGWKIRISNAQGVQIYPANGQLGLISQQQQTLSMSAWGGNGLYFLYLIDPQNNIQEVKKIVLAP
jgi:hypothetical protein